jgi:hypothetical protein
MPPHAVELAIEEDGVVARQVELGVSGSRVQDEVVLSSSGSHIAKD